MNIHASRYKKIVENEIMCQLPLSEPKKKCCGGQILFQTLLHTDGKCDLENCHGSSLPDKSFVIYGKWWLYHVQNLMASCLTFYPLNRKKGGDSNENGDGQMEKNILHHHFRHYQKSGIVLAKVSFIYK